MDAAFIKTMGMSCDACPVLIEKCLGRIRGVVAVDSDRRSSLTEVVFDPEKTDRLAISEEIRRLGFVTTVVDYPRFLPGDPALKEERLAPVPAATAARADGSARALDASEDVHVIHVRTLGLRCDECTALVERSLSHLDGVRHVISVRALGVTSVLFDGSIVARETIVDVIRGAGFDANVA